MPNAVHESHPWVVADIAPDFCLLDVWALPAHGTREEFASFVQALGSFDPESASPPAVRALFWVRRRLGALLGWDDEVARPIPGCAETTLRDRLPERLRGSVADGGLDAGLGAGDAGTTGGFTPLYLTDDEWAAELSNATVHGVLQLCWVEQVDGRHQARLAVYVKPRGRLGAAYLALIQPFRHLIVYPALTRRIGRAWDARGTKEG